MDNKRLVLEYRAMMERWPALHPVFCRSKAGDRLWWEVTLQAENGNTLPLKIVFPEDYPASPPDIVICEQMPPNTPHVLPGNRMCWRYPDEQKRSRNMWSPSRDTAAMCVSVAQKWFYAFLVWISIREWPVPDALV